MKEKKRMKCGDCRFFIDNNCMNFHSPFHDVMGKEQGWLTANDGCEYGKKKKPRYIIQSETMFDPNPQTELQIKLRINIYNLNNKKLPIEIMISDEIDRLKAQCLNALKKYKEGKNE